jgi:glyoxylase-like metal-dependent hydrolase (beta-lactamase superfamily II)
MDNSVKKIRKRVIIIPAIIIVVIIASILLIQPARMLIAMTSMEPLETQEVLPDVFAVNNGFVNFYLYKAGDKYIALDAGNDNKATQTALADLGIDASDVIAVFLTHTDGDHVAAVSLFASADIYISESNRIFMDKNTGRSRSKAFLDMGRNYTTLNDGERITVAGTEVQCIYTPGHTDGSACFIVDSKHLFTGDNLNLENENVTLFNSIFNMNPEEQKESIRILAQLNGIEVVFTAHTGYTTDFKRAFSQWVQ